MDKKYFEGYDLPYSENIKVLFEKVKIRNKEACNKLVIHPMEGADGNIDGSPGELTIRRYERLSKGGAGLIWFEAVAIDPEGRANPRQLWLTDKNIDDYKRLLERIKINSINNLLTKKEIPVIMQLTHSGRFSRPFGKPAPLITSHNPILDQKMKLPEEHAVLSDSQLEKLEDAYIKTALLAQKAGFDGVDFKCCHKYLISELVGGFTREGRYGGNFEGRTRFLYNIVKKLRNIASKDFIAACRMNIYDGISYPYGFGVDKDDFLKVDLNEPQKIVRDLIEMGVDIFNITMGTPYYNSHVNRPFLKGDYIPSEHYLKGVERLIRGVNEIQKSFPDIPMVATGLSILNYEFPFLAAGIIEGRLARMAGLGRQSFAYPDFANDLMKYGHVKKEKCCIACGKCTELMRKDLPSGCVIRDTGIYKKLYDSMKG